MGETVVIISLGIMLVILSAAWWVYHSQERLLFYPEKLPLDFSYQFPGRYKEIIIRSAGEHTINALHFELDSPEGVILYLHGNGGSLRGWGDVAPDFLVLQYEVFIIDYRGYGKSTGKITCEQDLLDDANLAYDYLLKKYPDEAIIIYGRSLGSGPAAYLAQTREPAKLILETPFISIKERTKAAFPFIPIFLLKYPLRNDHWLTQVKCPVYLFHGTADELIPYHSSVELVKKINSRHELFLIEGGHHNDLRTFPAYHEHMRSVFLK